ncbi:MAG: hypothetical protein H0V26_13455 [Solirubrobacterales bacterium]|nr:hypothetical protein [Solirubrobacterales bacterium]
MTRSGGAAPLSLWRPGPRRLTRLLVGLWLFGIGEALVVAAELGNSPWTVFAEGVSFQTPLSIGTATVVVSFVILLLWIPLGERPGLGTIANAVLVGVAIDATLAVLGRAPLGVRIGELVVGIALVGVGSGFYLGSALGPGPRDGLMTGLHRITGRSVALLRGGIEVSALVAGAVLGGTFGIGTLVFAVLIGPAVALALRVAPDSTGGRIRTDH